MTVSVQLTKGKIALIDDEDSVRVLAHVWRAHRAWSDRENWYAYSRIDGRKTYLHRFLTNASSGELFDHRDGDGLNNRRGNLRPCTRSQNQANTIMIPGPSGYFGVHFDSIRGKYRAVTYTKGKRVHIGYFVSAEKAARVRDIAQADLYGEFARRLNFPVAS